MIDSQPIRNIRLLSKCSCYILIYSLLTSLCVSVDTPQQIFNLKRTIETQIQLTKSLAVSPNDSEVIVGGKNGVLRVFNYETGQLLKQIYEHKSEITSILWQNDIQGLITISFDVQNNHSLAIQRNRISLQEVHRWQFDQYIYSADSISNRYDSYVGFNFMTRVQQYHLRSKRKSTVYKAGGSKRFIQMSYSSQYNYLYLSGNGQFMHVYRCGTSSGFYYSTNDTISRFQADKHNFQHTPVIYKKQNRGFTLLDPNYQYNVTFPSQNIDYFKYCPKDYMLGITLDQKINIYTRDYHFTKLGVVNTFADKGIFIFAVSCQNQKIVVSASDHNIYVFQLIQPVNQPSNKWFIVVILSASVTLAIFLISIFIFKKIKKNKQNRKKASLLSSTSKSSLISQFSN